jgi:RNA polymerase sigma-70 factor (ECF subfamily)
LSQRETARRLGVTENVVEKEIARGLRTIMSRWGELDRPAEFRDTTQEDAERGQR